MPYVVLSVEAAARGLDPRLERAARSLGATAWQALRRVTLPLVRRGVLAGALFAAIVSFDEVVVALFVGGPATTTLPRKMWSTITQDEFNPLLTAVATLQMVVALGLLGVVARLAAAGRPGDGRAADPAGGDAPSARSAASRRRETPTPATRDGARLRLADLTKRFDAVTAVDRLTLEVEPGELMTLLGPSGCGKTTVLNLIAGFETPDGGAIRDGRRRRGGASAAPPRGRDGVPGLRALPASHRPGERGLSAPRPRDSPEPELTERVDAMLELVRLPGYGDRLPRQLSGGQQQRVALARALVFHPRVLLMDEPFGALDRALRETMRAELRELHRTLGITVVLVTHDQDEAMDLSDRVAVMRAGRVQQVATPRVLYERPASAFVAGFVGESNLLDAVVLSVDGETAVLRTAGGRRIRAADSSVRVGDRVVALLRPDAAVIGEAGPGDDGLAGVIEDVSEPGPSERGRVRLDGGERVTLSRPRRAGGPALLRGARIALSWPAAEVRLLPPEP